jgi:hypothetical protein
VTASSVAVGFGPGGGGEPASHLYPAASNLPRNGPLGLGAAFSCGARAPCHRSRTPSLEYGLHRAQYDSLVRELEEVGFRVRLSSRRAASRSTWAFGAFYDLVIRLSTDSGTNLDALIERIQHLLSSDELPPMPRMGKVILDDGTKHAFPLDEADVP